MFIVLEGLDGAGKSTQIKALQAHFEAQEKQVHFIHFPRFDAPVYGPLIARFLRGELGSIAHVDPYLVALLFAGDRADLGPQIRAWLDAGHVVLADRYVYSNIAFQCAKLPRPQEREALRQWIIDAEFGYFQLPRPHLNLFLDVPLSFVETQLKAPRHGEDRAYLQGKEDIHEASLSFQQQVRAIYLEQAALDGQFKVVPCGNTQGEMLPCREVFERIKAFL